MPVSQRGKGRPQDGVPGQITVCHEFIASRDCRCESPMTRQTLSNSSFQVSCSWVSFFSESTWACATPLPPSSAHLPQDFSSSMASCRWFRTLSFWQLLRLGSASKPAIWVVEMRGSRGILALGVEDAGIVIVMVANANQVSMPSTLNVNSCTADTIHGVLKHRLRRST